ncbi:MAG: hypothetical protein Q7R39_01005 [Dehalococcoidia bacterium]|nr:hypothetical protein [Dehalococcoidia bacterium]
MEPEALPAPESPPPHLPPRREGGVAIGGILLILVGIWFLVGNLSSLDIGRAFLLVLGIGFLLAYFLGRRNVGFLIPGGILSGIGLGTVLEPLGRETQGGVVLVCMGFGFLTIWVFERRHVWAAIAGGVLAAIGVYNLTRGIAAVEEAGRWWPVLLIFLGGWILYRRIQPTRRGG